MKPIEHYLEQLDRFFHTNLYECERFNDQDCLQEQRLAAIETYESLRKKNIELEDKQIIVTMMKRAIGSIKQMLCTQGHYLKFPNYQYWKKYKDEIPDCSKTLHSANVPMPSQHDNIAEEIYVRELLAKHDSDNTMLFRLLGYKYGEIAKKINKSKSTAYLKVQRAKGNIRRQIKNDI